MSRCRDVERDEVSFYESVSLLCSSYTLLILISSSWSSKKEKMQSRGRRSANYYVDDDKQLERIHSRFILFIWLRQRYFTRVRQFLVLLFEFPWQQDFQIYFLNRNFFNLFVAVNFRRNLSGLVENHGMRSHWSLKIMSDSLKLEIIPKFSWTHFVILQCLKENVVWSSLSFSHFWIPFYQFKIVVFFFSFWIVRNFL